MVEVFAETDRLRALLRQVGERSRAGLRRSLDRAGARHVQAMAERFVPYSGRRAGFGSADIQTRSGALRRAFGWAVSPSGGELRIFAAGLPYIRAQEFGATIHPRPPRKFLTVPLPPALTAGGSLKGGARLVRRGDRWETADGSPTVIFTGRSGFGVIARVLGSGKRRRLVNLYALRPFVRLRPRLGFVSTFYGKTAPGLEADLGRALKEATA